MILHRWSFTSDYTVFAFQELKKKDAKLKTVSDEYEERYPHTCWLFLLCKLIAVFRLLANQSQLSIFYTP